MDKGFLYYVWFPQISVFKVGRTIQGLKRFNNIDYLKFYKQYHLHNIYAWIHMISLNNHKIVENRIHSIYKSCDFKLVGKKTEFYYTLLPYEYKLSREIFIDITNYYNNNDTMNIKYNKSWKFEKLKFEK